jgi:NAD(P)-dependent dehydrogenase (short-subunit alcohol dehydrogenase family)
VRTAIVTGSDSGIGRATAVALAAAGHHVGITFHTDEAGAQATARAVASLGRRAAVRHLELADPASAAETVDDLAAALGRLDVLVNNAGANHRAPVLDDPLEDWRHALDVNLTGPFACAQAAARRLAAQGEGGRIVFVTSVHEHEPLRFASAYSAAKAGAGMAARVMALELAGHGITVNAVAPGHVATAMTGKDGIDPETCALPQIPLGRPAAPKEIAALIAWLASREAAYVTGASIVVDGGLLLTAAVALQDAVEGPMDTAGSR